MFRGTPNGISDTLAEKRVRTASVSQRDGMVESVACDHTGSFPSGFVLLFCLALCLVFRL